MALLVDQQFKHFCRICKKGFVCGRALGGHMRAHGIGDEGGGAHLDDDDPASDWEDNKLGSGASGDPPTANKRMYALRTNPNRLKTCRVCENCGKEFVSWKSFLEHGKCSSDEAESLVSSPGSAGDDDEEEEEEDYGGATAGRGGGWSKRKRSFRAKVGQITTNNAHCPSSEEEDLANCLMMLSNGIVDPVEPEDSCASASKDEERRHHAYAPSPYRATFGDKAKGAAAGKGLFECKACKKVFNSHQALGGHRASHKKVKGCFAARLDSSHLEEGLGGAAADDDIITHDEFLPPASSSKHGGASFMQMGQYDSGSGTGSLLGGHNRRKTKVHECSICHRVFSSGQALGGHKRCHWITSNSPETTPLSVGKYNPHYHHHQQQHHHHHQTMHDHSEQQPIHPITAMLLDMEKTEPLDLNLPAPNDGVCVSGVRRDAANPLSFEVSTEIYLKSWTGIDHSKENVENEGLLRHRGRIKNEEEEEKNTNNNEKIEENNDDNNEDVDMEDDGAVSKVKLAKLSDLKDMSPSAGSSPWLQVGIGSTTDVGGT